PVEVLVQSATLPDGQQDCMNHGSVSASSTRPLQSSSTPLQVSGVGPVEPLQTLVPFWHMMVPAAHAPWQPAGVPPGQLVPQATPTSVSLSSTMPLQSSSMPLQISGIGPTI